MDQTSVEIAEERIATVRDALTLAVAAVGGLVTVSAGRGRGRFGSRRVVAALGVVAATAAFTGCGSSKPAYCTDRSDLETTVKALPGFVTSRDLSGLLDQVATIEDNANTLVDSAKKDFPSQTEAITSSVQTLHDTVQALPADPTSSDFVQVGVDAAATVSAVRRFSQATSSDCE
ncbi:MAG: hypothetical protein U0S48_13530 [Solirubrobacteraceae bacterium]